MTDLARDRELYASAAKARRRRARRFAGMLVGLTSGFVLYVGINLLALAVAP